MVQTDSDRSHPFETVDSSQSGISNEMHNRGGLVGLTVKYGVDKFSLCGVLSRCMWMC